LTLILLTLFSHLGFGQHYFGFPSESKNLKKGDIIILNIPRNIDGRFLYSDELNSLISFINNNDNSIKIEIYVFFLKENSCMLYSDLLCKSLVKELLEKSIKRTYEVISKGNTKPLFCNFESEEYKRINTRIEILIN